jgi:NAD(P)-dependent dehydrogenase (short-subunit alcohol dehydrogenase family)
MPRPAVPSFSLSGRLSKEPRLAGQTAVISGASRGFGAAIAVRFVEEGANVVLLSRSSCDDTLAAVRAIEGVTPEYAAAHTLWVPADIETEAACEGAAAAAAARFGPKVHVLVNNAALFVFHSVETATAADWDRSAAVNIKGHALLTKAFLPALKAAGADTPTGASIVFQGSISAFLAQPNCATYAAMKGAIVQLARNCAYDFAKYNIRVNSVCAGTVETPISAEERAAHGWSYAAWEALKTKDVMLGRVGHVREVANATLFFAGPEASYCTGTHLMVDGGQVPTTVMEWD